MSSILAPAPVSFTVSLMESRPKIRVTFHDDPDVGATYESPYPGSRAEQTEEAYAVAKVARLRADMIWTNGAEYEVKVATVSLMLTVLGFIIRD